MSNNLESALAEAGSSDDFRSGMIDLLRKAEAQSRDPELFRERVRWPLLQALIGQGGIHRLKLKNGLLFDLSLDSRIEKAALLSTDPHLDHIWEPQTTRLLIALSAGASNVLIGGAYIGDQALPLAQHLRANSPVAVVHAFEPMIDTYNKLLRNIDINGLSNIRPHQHALWDCDGMELLLSGEPALAGAAPLAQMSVHTGNTASSVTIDSYVRREQLDQVDVIMLDTEGGEECALRGAKHLLSRPATASPDLIFEIHRFYVDWSNGLHQTAVVSMLLSFGYQVYAVRDYHANLSTQGQAIEVIPVDRVYLDGPPHGFNLLASKDPDLIEKYDLRVVYDVSPKYLPGKDPALHAPLPGAFLNTRSEQAFNE